jgi:hypothetical protein
VGQYTFTCMEKIAIDIIKDHFETLMVSSVLVNTGGKTGISEDKAILSPIFGYSQAELDVAVSEERERWDVNGDGRVGHEEAIRALQIDSGVQ